MAFKETTINTVTFLILLFITISCFVQEGFAARVTESELFSSKKALQSEKDAQISNEGEISMSKGISIRRVLIGSRAPVCTYNECRGCRLKCSAEQVPVDANDPMNSAYHYKCVCHR